METDCNHLVKLLANAEKELVNSPEIAKLRDFVESYGPKVATLKKDIAQATTRFKQAVKYFGEESAEPATFFALFQALETAFKVTLV
jgi:hypothetical protein